MSVSTCVGVHNKSLSGATITAHARHVHSVPFFFLTRTLVPVDADLPHQQGILQLHFQFKKVRGPPPQSFYEWGIPSKALQHSTDRSLADLLSEVNGCWSALGRGTSFFARTLFGVGRLDMGTFARMYLRRIRYCSWEMQDPRHFLILRPS